MLHMLGTASPDSLLCNCLLYFTDDQFSKETKLEGDWFFPFHLLWNLVWSSTLHLYRIKHFLPRGQTVVSKQVQSSAWSPFNLQPGLL